MGGIFFQNSNFFSRFFVDILSVDIMFHNPFRVKSLNEDSFRIRSETKSPFSGRSFTRVFLGLEVWQESQAGLALKIFVLLKKIINKNAVFSFLSIFCYHEK